MGISFLLYKSSKNRTPKPFNFCYVYDFLPRLCWQKLRRAWTISLIITKSLDHHCNNISFNIIQYQHTNIFRESRKQQTNAHQYLRIHLMKQNIDLHVDIYDNTEIGLLNNSKWLNVNVSISIPSQNLAYIYVYTKSNQRAQIK